MSPEHGAITYAYYLVIVLILGYAVYDTFFKKT